MTVKEAIQNEFEKLSQMDKVVFLGENIINSGRVYGLLDKVPLGKCIEMPVAENLIAGCAVGLAIRGYVPVVVFQRMDFMLIAADAIINHACLMPKMTGINLPILFIAVKANLNEKFYVGLQHSKDLSHVFEPYMNVIQVPALIDNLGKDDPSITDIFTPREQPKLLVLDKESFNNSL